MKQNKIKNKKRMREILKRIEETKRGTDYDRKKAENKHQTRGEKPNLQL